MAKSSITDRWVEFFTQQLEEIVKTGKYVPKYAHSLPKRVNYAVTLTCCATTCCAPCCMWDTMCSLTEIVCKKSCCWGMFCTFIGRSCADMMHDTKDDIWKEFEEQKKEIDLEKMQDICKRYLIEFDLHVAMNNVEGAKIANQIRFQLHQMVHSFSPRPLHLCIKESDVDALRRAIYEEWDNTLF